MTSLPGVKSVVAVTGGKGGVGKSTLAVNLAAGLAQTGISVGLLDLDLAGPSVPIMLGVSLAASQTAVLEPVKVHGIRMMSSPFFAPREPVSSWQGEKARQAVRDLLGKVDWGTLDLLLVDLPPGERSITDALVECVTLRGVVLVSTPQDVALQEVQVCLEEFRRQHIDILGLVENMSFYICSSCGHRDHIFGHGNAADLATRLGVAYFGAVPIDAEVRKCSDSGMPVVLKQQESPAREALRHVVKSLTERLAA